VFFAFGSILGTFFLRNFLLSDGNNNALLRIHCLQRRQRTPRTMASVAEQNALRCKEAGNALYKSERYEEVRRFCGFARIIFFSSRRHVSFSFSLSKRFPIRVYENAHISNHLCRLTTGVSSLFSLSLRARARVRNRPSKNIRNPFDWTIRTRPCTPTERRHISISNVSPKRFSTRKRARPWTKSGRKGIIAKRDVYTR